MSDLVAILGAGPVGRALGEEMRKRGVPVRFVTRSGIGAPGTEARAADITNPEALAEAVRGASVLIHTAGVPYQLWSQVFPVMQNAVLGVAEKVGAAVVFAENLYSYAADTMPLNERSEERPVSKKGALRKALSQQWMDAHAAGRVKAASVRSSDYFGPGATDSENSHFGARFFPAFRAGKPVAFVGNPDAAHSYTYLPDYARALADVALNPDAWGRPWVCPAVGPITARQLAEKFAAAAGTSVKVGALPRFALSLIGLFTPVVKEMVEMLYQFEKPFTVDSREFEARFGWKATALDTAVGETWVSASPAP